MAKKTKAKPASKGSFIAGAVGKAKSAVGGLMGGSSAKAKTGRKSRTKSVSYWANKVLKAKLIKKYNRIKYGGI